MSSVQCTTLQHSAYTTSLQSSQTIRLTFLVSNAAWPDARPRGAKSVSLHLCETKKIRFDAVIRLHMHTDMSRIAVITTCYRSCLELMTTSSQLAVIIPRSYTCLGVAWCVCETRSQIVLGELRSRTAADSSWQEGYGCLCLNYKRFLQRNVRVVGKEVSWGGHHPAYHWGGTQ